MNDVASLYSGVIWDTLYFDMGVEPRVLPIDLKRIGGMGGYLLGRVFPAYGMKMASSNEEDWEEVDSIRVEMLDEIQEGDVAIIAGCSQEVACFGDITALSLAQAKSVGAIIDGYTRDSWAFDERGYLSQFPVYARGTRPEDAYGKWYISSYGDIQMNVGDVQVSSSDCVFADSDSIIVFDESILRDVLEHATARVRKENHVRSQMVTGTPARDVYADNERW